MPQDGNISDVRERILHVLSIYPKVSPSMLQIALNMPIKIWHPVLEALISDGHVSRASIVSPTPSGRHQSYTILSSSKGVEHE